MTRTRNIKRDWKVFEYKNLGLSFSDIALLVGLSKTAVFKAYWRVRKQLSTGK